MCVFISDRSEKYLFRRGSGLMFTFMERYNLWADVCFINEKNLCIEIILHLTFKAVFSPKIKIQLDARYI